MKNFREIFLAMGAWHGRKQPHFSPDGTPAELLLSFKRASLDYCGWRHMFHVFQAFAEPPF